MDELTAIRACQAGEVAAFSRLVELHHAHLYRTAYDLLGDAQRAEEIVQDTFLILAQRLPRLTPGPLRGWLGRVVVNLCRSERRRPTPIPFASLPTASQPLDAADMAPGPEALAEAQEEQVRLRTVVAALAVRQRAMVVLRYYGGFSLQEIATALGCRPGTVSATLHHALTRLRTELQGEEPREEPETPRSPGHERPRHAGRTRRRDDHVSR